MKIIEEIFWLCLSAAGWMDGWRMWQQVARLCVTRVDMWSIGMHSCHGEEVMTVIPPH